MDNKRLISIITILFLCLTSFGQLANDPITLGRNPLAEIKGDQGLTGTNALPADLSMIIKTPTTTEILWLYNSSHDLTLDRLIGDTLHGTWQGDLVYRFTNSTQDTIDGTNLSNIVIDENYSVYSNYTINVVTQFVWLGLQATNIGTGVTNCSITQHCWQ